jgi:hypothetical protein
VLSQLTSFIRTPQFWKGQSTPLNRWTIGFRNAALVATPIGILGGPKKPLTELKSSTPITLYFDATVGVTFSLNGLEAVSDEGLETLANTLVSQHLGIKGSRFEVRWSRISKGSALVTAIRQERLNQLNAWIGKNGLTVIEIRPAVAIAIHKLAARPQKRNESMKFVLRTRNTFEAFVIENNSSSAVTVAAPVYNADPYSIANDFSFLFERFEINNQHPSAQNYELVRLENL